MSDRILKRIHRFLQRVDRRLAQPIFRKRPRRPPVVEPTVESFNCETCGLWSACGWTVDGKRLCNLCARPYVRARYDLEREQIPPRLAGDPR